MRPGRSPAGGQHLRSTARRCEAPATPALTGRPCNLLAVLDQQASAVLGQVDVDGKTNEVTQFAPLLGQLDLAGHVVTADALHTQRGHAEFLVTGKNAHYIFIVKKNQPGLYAQLKRLPWRQVPVAGDPRQRGHGRADGAL